MFLFMLWVLIRIASTRPHQGYSNEYPQYMFLRRTDGNYPSFITKYPPYLVFVYKPAPLPRPPVPVKILGSRTNSVDPDQTHSEGTAWSGFTLFAIPSVSFGSMHYRKFPKYSDTQKICCNHSKIWTMWLYHRVMSPNDADGMANSVDPDQTAPLGAVWSGSALFAQAYLSENLGSLQYSIDEKANLFNL